MPLIPGSRLGPYEILAPIGAGDMGEVYRARDPRLGRDVAVKVLPASFSADADRLRRFEQEARPAGVLNHPNITAVHDIGANTSDGAPYVVQELLEGETLRTALSVWEEFMPGDATGISSIGASAISGTARPSSSVTATRCRTFTSRKG